MLAENERIGWHPEHIKHGRFGKWLEGNVDWALSRSRYWGTPLPIWECAGEDCEERFCAGSVADLRERGGDVTDDLHRPFVDEIAIDCEACGAEMRRVPEVIDTWYDSGAMPFAQFHYPFENEELFEQRFPADFICEAIDQTRGWFYSQLAESVLLFDQTDYLNCVCLGLILDPEGRKMSKRLGNLVDPHEVIDAHGADAFRWYYLASQQPWAGYRFSTETVGEAVRQFLLTLWNTYSFYVLYANAEGIDPAGTAGGSRLRRLRRARRLGRAPRPLGGLAAGGDDRDGARGARRLRLDHGRQGDRRLRRRALQLVRAGRPPALLGRGRRGLRHAAPLPAGDGPAARPVHPLHGGRDLVEPRAWRRGRRRALGPPDRLPGERGRSSRRAARGRHGGGAARGRARQRGARPRQGEDAPAPCEGRDRRDRGRAADDRGFRRRGPRRAQRQAARVRHRGGRARRLLGEAQLPDDGPALRQGDAAGRGRGRVARPRPRPRGDRRRARDRDLDRRATTTRSPPRT